ncbi:MAG TPA: (E)-4-hydroxy-3-methylbut-2-enyl-diphosphate synthase [Bacteroidales bacterium]|nr:(E)-4-hydroxy-3-methylbut-2-enyl-diphosphate synthase [Bacteroidales bacterium]
MAQGVNNRAHMTSSYRSPVISVGSLALGGENPIRIQSMTNTDTNDTNASAEQCIRIIEAGADLVRLTAQGVKEAENLKNIKKKLRKAGFDTPLIADIHFTPAAAETAARIVEKIRINPGNYADKKTKSTRTNNLPDKEYDLELERIHERLLPLINICRENGTVIRLGINHGSLSDRIINRHGNTPTGIVVSAIEFIKIFLSENFSNLVISVKSSNTGILVESNRLLVNMLQKFGLSYPIHLGVTEAGEGEDGRIRSAAGIGTLLAEGIGDTIRVSLSENPENEIPVAKEIVRFLCGSKGRITHPLEQVPFLNRTSLYKPEVITYNNGRYLKEDNTSYQGNMLIFNHRTPPLLTGKEKGNIILNPVFSEDDPERLAINSAALLGRYFILKLADGLCITNSGKIQGDKLKDLAFSILQATEARITRNKYISCPTCGRTKFNLQDAVKKVKEATAHLTGLKIAIMGCVVNGPGEMAGSDYGYVGAAKGKVHIYRGQTPVLKNIPEEDAINELLRIINEDGQAGNQSASSEDQPSQLQ